MSMFFQQNHDETKRLILILFLNGHVYVMPIVHGLIKYLSLSRTHKLQIAQRCDGNKRFPFSPNCHRQC
jgi:hypothetical protein